MGLGVAQDMTNQAEADDVVQVPCAASSTHAAPMEVEESVAVSPGSCSTTSSRLMDMALSCRTSQLKSLLVLTSPDILV